MGLQKWLIDLGKRSKKTTYKLLLIFMIAVISLPLVGCNEDDINNVIEQTAQTVYEKTPSPQNASIGGEWALIGMLNSNIDTDKKEICISRYYDNVRRTVKSKKGILSESYTTEYARTIMGLCAAGKDPRNVEGYDLTIYLDNSKMTMNQGINGACYALIASEMAGIKLSNEQTYISYIMEATESLNVSTGTDYISMSVLALSPYKENKNVTKFLEKQIDKLSDVQLRDGSLGSCESTAECIIALSTAGVDVEHDERFIKENKNLFNGLMIFYKDDGFVHTKDDQETDMMATEKGLLALESIESFKNGQVLYKSLSEEGAIEK